MNFPKDLKKPKYISNSQLSAFRKSPQHWIQYLKDREEEEKKEAYILGSLVHILWKDLPKTKIMKEVKEQFFILNLENKPEPERNFVNAKNRDWKQAELNKRKNGQTVIDSDLMNVGLAMTKALYDDDVSRKLIKGAKEWEKKLSWETMGLNCHGYEDATCEDYVLELKTTPNADPHKFQRDLFSLGYYRQGGMYLDGEMNGEMSGDPHKRFFFIAVESVGPYGVSVHELTEEVISFGVSEYRRLAQNLKDCIKSDWFPSYQYRNINETFDVFLPNYMMEV